MNPLSPIRAFQHSEAPRSERGAVLVLIASALVVVMLSGAVAVDISSLQREGDKLQAASDAAALAGAAVWASSGDQEEARATVQEIIAQNGVNLGADRSFNVNFPASNEVEVVITDSDPDALLSGFAPGVASRLERAATARWDRCEDCYRVEEAPAPLRSIDAGGSGDGWKPIAYGTRVYAVNHHGATVQCVDRLTQRDCWGGNSKVIDGNRLSQTYNAVYTHVVGSKVYFLRAGTGQNGKGRNRIHCWDMAIEDDCVEYTTSPYGLLPARDLASIGIEDRMYFFSAVNLKVFCVELPHYGTCPGYEGGIESHLFAVPPEPLGGWHLARTNKFEGMRAYNVGDQIFVTAYDSKYKVWVHCWDIVLRKGCQDHTGQPTFFVHPLPNVLWGNARASFIYREPNGDPRSFCGLQNPGRGTARGSCVFLTDGSPDYRAMAAIDAMAMADVHSFNEGVYHPFLNREYILESTKVWCFDFNTASSCGGPMALPPASYALEVFEYCLFGTNHYQDFFSIHPDLVGSCDHYASLEFDLYPCECAGGKVWASIGAINTEGTTSMSMRVEDPDGNQLLPVEGGDPIELLDGEFDLNEFLDTESFPYVHIVVEITEEEGVNAWEEDPPSVEVGAQQNNRPRLVK